MLKDLLDAKDAAIADDDAKSIDLDEKRAALVAAEEAKVKSAEARVAAHKAIHDLLAAKGYHHITSDDGTVTIYQAVDDGNGWNAFQPIPGSMSNPPNV